MKNSKYTTPEIEVLNATETDILTASDSFVFLPPDEFGEI